MCTIDPVNYDPPFPINKHGRRYYRGTSDKTVLGCASATNAVDEESRTPRSPCRERAWDAISSNQVLRVDSMSAAMPNVYRGRLV